MCTVVIVCFSYWCVLLKYLVALRACSMYAVILRYHIVIDRRLFVFILLGLVAMICCLVTIH